MTERALQQPSVISPVAEHLEIAGPSSSVSDKHEPIVARYVEADAVWQALRRYAGRDHGDYQSDGRIIWRFSGYGDRAGQFGQRRDKERHGEFDGRFVDARSPLSRRAWFVRLLDPGPREGQSLGGVGG